MRFQPAVGSALAQVALEKSSPLYGLQVLSAKRLPFFAKQITPCHGAVSAQKKPELRAVGAGGLSLFLNFVYYNLNFFLTYYQSCDPPVYRLVGDWDQVKWPFTPGRVSVRFKF